MSQQADTMRDRRRHWAAAGGALDKVVRAFQTGLPVGVGALVAVMLVAPFSQRSEVSFLLDKNEIAVVRDRVRIERADYSGFDSQGRPFSIRADHAVQRSAADPVVRMEGLSAQIGMAEGPARLNAANARYDPARETVMAQGLLDFATADGYRISASGVGIDLKRRLMMSVAPVSGTLPIGQFSADRMRADLNERRVRLDGRVRLRINQGVIN